VPIRASERHRYPKDFRVIRASTRGTTMSVSTVNPDTGELHDGALTEALRSQREGLAPKENR
jgi:hypothetical protein